MERTSALLSRFLSIVFSYIIARPKNRGGMVWACTLIDLCMSIVFITAVFLNSSDSSNGFWGASIVFTTAVRGSRTLQKVSLVPETPTPSFN